MYESEILKETEHLKFCESLEATCQSLKVRILFGSLPPSSMNEFDSLAKTLVQDVGSHLMLLL